MKYIINNCAIVTNTKITGTSARTNSIMCAMPTTAKCKKSDFRVIGTYGDYPYATDPISGFHNRKTGITVIGSGKDEGITWKVNSLHKYYLEFLEAMKDDKISVLNHAFVVEVENDKNVTRFHIMDKHLADENSLKFDGRKIVAQCFNFVLLDNGVIGWVNWLCLARTSNQAFMHMYCGEAELNRLYKENPCFRGPNGPTERFVNIKPYEFIGDEVGYHLLCDQVENFDELMERAEMQKK